jgi:UDP-glucose 4-epimerase
VGLVGGAGLIGSTITDLLLSELSDEIEEIRIFDDFSRGTRANLANALQDPRVRIIEGDVRDRHAVNKAFIGADAVFHLAAIRITRCASEPRLANDILVNGTFNVLEAAVEQNIDKVILSSSASVYGLADQFPTPETQHPYNNETIYGAAKAYNEGLARSFKAMYDLDYVALRYFNAYGPRMDTEGKYTEVFIRWMNNIATGQAPVIYGDGSATMDFVYVGDIARANLAALQSNVTDEVFNVARGEETSLRQLAETLLRVMGSDLELAFKDVVTAGGVARRKADVSKAERLLGFRAEKNLEEGLTELVNWWQSLPTASKSEAVAR